MDAGSAPSTGSKHRATAKASWMLFVLAFMVNFVGVKAGMVVLHELVVLVLFVAGVACGALALTGVRRHGRKGILVPALIGLVLNAVMLAVWIGNFTSARDRARERTAAPAAPG